MVYCYTVLNYVHTMPVILCSMYILVYLQHSYTVAYKIVSWMYRFFL
jgi:hypothetical protein